MADDGLSSLSSHPVQPPVANPDRRGHLRIYVGAFPGVGKTYAMLHEAQRRRSYGEDVIVGFVETHGRRNTALLLEGLEVLPRKRVEYHGVVLDEMDVEAVLQRRPAVCLVDELAHTNAPGSQRQKRYEDVEVILDAGIDVVSTLNIQHLESLNGTVESLTGVKVRETIPDAVFDQADEVILVDLSPEGARARMEHGHIYPPEQARAALEHFFRPENLSVLREIALKRTAQEVDVHLDALMREDAHVPEVEERVLVLIDARPEARQLIRSAWRLAQGLRADLLIAYRNDDLNEGQRRELARSLELAEDLNAHLLLIEGEDEVEAVEALIRREGVRHLVMEMRTRRGMGDRLKRPLYERLADTLESLEVHLLRLKE